MKFPIFCIGICNMYYLQTLPIFNTSYENIRFFKRYKYNTKGFRYFNNKKLE